MNNRKPTLKQKIKIYEKALVEIETENSVGLCNALVNAQDQLGFTNDMGNTRYSIRLGYFPMNFPEIYKHKPENKSTSDFWWAVSHYMSLEEKVVSADGEGKQIRIEVLKGAIAELQGNL